MSRAKIFADLFFHAFQMFICFRNADFDTAKTAISTDLEETHCILNGYMEIPKAVVFRNLDPSPDRRFTVFERDLELIDISEFRFFC